MSQHRDFSREIIDVRGDGSKTASYVEISPSLSYEENLDARPFSPTEALNVSLHRLFDYLNENLFGPHLKNKAGNRIGTVQDCIITVQSKGRAEGFTKRTVWSNHTGRYLDEIGISLNAHSHGDILGIAQTMAHEMCHAVQNERGQSGKYNYHNAQFRDWMRNIGLQTSQTGMPGGKETGVGMSDYPIQDGPFELTVSRLVRSGFSIPLEVVDSIRNPQLADPEGECGSNSKSKDQSKIKFSCSAFGQNAWTKSTAILACTVSGCASVPMLSSKE